MLIKKYKYQKVLEEDISFNLPLEEIYLFQFHVRRSIKVTPIWTSRNKEQFDKEEEIWRLDFVIVYGGMHDPTIIKKSVQLSQLEDIYMVGKGEMYELLEFISGREDENIRTKEQFEADFNDTLRKIQGID